MKTRLEVFSTTAVGVPIAGVLIPILFAIIALIVLVLFALMWIPLLLVVAFGKQDAEGLFCMFGVKIGISDDGSLRGDWSSK